MKFSHIKSSNFSNKPRKLKNIKFIIIHYTGMQSKRVSIKRLLSKKHKVSCHYIIDRNGFVIQMVKDQNIAWHAGKSKWQNYQNLNENSIGIELINKGHQYGYEKFSKKQVHKLIKLCLYLKKKYKIKKSNFIGHSDIAPLRKKDPGEKFPWHRLSTLGIGNWYPLLKESQKKLSENKIRELFFKNIYIIGYRYFNKKNPDKKVDSLLIKAFKRRYMPAAVNSVLDAKTLEISYFLANHKKN